MLKKQPIELEVKQQHDIFWTIRCKFGYYTIINIMVKKQSIHIENGEICLISQGHEEYNPLINMVHIQMGEHLMIKWFSLKRAIEYIREWETLFYPNFNYTEFGTIRNLAYN
ncbi:MAG: hypothetical protein AB9833_07745 [Bacteroidales bacterium]